MQPVQDLSVEDRVSRTQFQYTLEDPNLDELNAFAPQMLAKLQQLPELRDVASDQQVLGLRAKLVFDRDTAARLGITTAAIDQTLYDAYGQRQVSTMFTQLNQYHVVLEVQPGFQNESGEPERSVHPTRLRDCQAASPAATAAVDSVRRLPERRPDPAQRVLARADHDRSDHGESSGPVSRGDAVVQPGAERVARARR